VKKWTLGLVLAVFLLSVPGVFAPVSAAPESSASESTGRLKGHFASKGDMIGFWKMVQMPEAVRQKINKVEPWKLPYQWFAFYDDGSFKSFMSSNDNPQLTARDLDKIFANVRNNVSFEFINGFLRVTYSDIKGYVEYWGVNVVENTIDFAGVHYEAGDLLMSLADNATGAPCYYRLLRRLP
jgi:hypothetical protein